MPDVAEGKSRAAADRDAEFASWMHAYGPALRRFLARRVGPSDADEMVQDVFLAVHARKDAGPVQNPQGYLFRAARHLMARRRGGLHDGWMPLAPVASALDTVSPERHLIARQELDHVLAAIEKLPPRAREAFVLHRFEEMTYAKIAGHMGISLSAVRQLISRSLHQIVADIGRPM